MIAERVTRGSLGRKALPCIVGLAAVLAMPASATAAGWSTGPSLHLGRAAFGTAALPNGGVLVAGGELGGLGVKTATAEVYNPVTGAFDTTGSMGAQRDWPAAAPLPDGRVLVAGGKSQLNAALSTAEIYNPATRTFSNTTSMATARESPAAVALPDGRVLVMGGFNPSDDALTSVEAFDPRTQTWSSNGSLNAPRTEEAAAVLSDGRVLVYGGVGAGGNSYEIYNPATGTSAPSVDLGYFPYSPGAASFADGRVLIAGGLDPATLFNWERAQIFDVATGAFGDLPPMAKGRNAPGIARLADGRMIVIGGVGNASNDDFMASSEIYAPGADPQADGTAFAKVAALKKVARTVTITNRGEQSMRVSLVGLRGDSDFAISGTDCAGKLLVYLGSCTVDVSFTPGALGERKATLRLTGDAIDGNTRDYDLTGTGTKLRLRTKLRGHPPRRMAATGPRTPVKFRFRSPDKGSKFMCRIDRSRFSKCRSPKRYRLEAGKHVFRVKAVSALGADPTPAKFRFRIAG